MHLAIDAVGTYGRGGAAVLEGLLATLGNDERIKAVTVFVSTGLRIEVPLKARLELVKAHDSARRLQWALGGWARARERCRADRALSFNGFSIATDQTIFIHNALYYDEARKSLQLGLRTRLHALRRMTGVASRLARNVVVQTAWMRGLVSQAYRLEPDEIVVAPCVPAPVEPADKRIVRDGPGPHLLFVGSELAYKDTSTFEDLVAASAGTGHMIGNFGRVEAAPGCHWYGELRRAEVFGAYRDADCLVMTSRCESFGLPLVEAMQSGLAILAVDLPYAREICGDEATYFEPGSATDALRKLQDTSAPSTTRLANLELERGFESLVEACL